MRIVYASRYGSTQTYAEWLAEALSCPATPLKQTTPQELFAEDKLIFGSGVYASGLAYRSWFHTYALQLKPKIVLAFAVGASPFDRDALEALKKHNLPPALQEIPFFYLRGRWDESRMSFVDRTLCRLLKRSVKKKDPAVLQPWEQALLETQSGYGDWMDKNALGELVEAAKRAQ